VAVSLYNYEEFIGACLASILSQTWADLDLVVVDDASPNENALVVARDWMVAHAQRFRRALLLRHRRNQGLAMTRNTAFRHALRDFVFVIDCDNMLYPRATTRLRQVLQDGDFSAAYSQLAEAAGGGVSHAAIVDLLDLPFVAAAAGAIVRVPDLSVGGQVGKMLLVVLGIGIDKRAGGHRVDRWSRRRC
jgi:glycosyltransferase involved in cell wall biosynthesis